MHHVGRLIGNIRIGEPLGEGGMGAVYLGFDETLRRQVAVKAIRSDRLDDDSRARFLTEARILSRLDHPNVCRIHEYLEGDGEDFLILELITGKTLAAAIHAPRPVAGKLRIAGQVASALAAAHGKGIVHRDLKPGNVMLTPESGVKVLDFGLARTATPHDQEASQKTAETKDSPATSERGDGTSTETGEGPSYWLPTTIASTQQDGIVGTPSNMSPEQARGEPATAASDMYSFGLLMQELCTGQSAYPAGISADLLRIKAADGDTLPVAGLDKDLEALIGQLKSIAPEARPTAAAAAAGLRRIRDQPRRRLRRLAVALGLVAVAAGVFQYVTALQRERDQASSSRQAAIEARVQAETAQQEAEQVTEFLVELIEKASPEAERGADVTVAEVLEQSTERIDDLAGQPGVQARVRFTIAEVFLTLGQYQEALALHRQALAAREEVYGPESLEVASSLSRLALLLEEIDDYPEALSHATRAVGIYDRNPDLGHRYRKDMTAAMLGLASISSLVGDVEQAESIYQRLLAVRRRHLPPDHPDLGKLLGEIAVFHYTQMQFDKSVTLTLEALAINEKTFGPNHPEVGNVLSLLSACYWLLDDLEQAKVYGERAIEVLRLALGPEHSDIAVALYSLGGIAMGLGELEQAQRLMTQAIEIWEPAMGPGFSGIANALGRLSEIELAMGRLEAAVALTDRSLAIKRQVASSVGELSLVRGFRFKASLLALQGDRSGAKKLLLEALDIAERTVAPGHVEISRCQHELANRIYQHDAPERARELYRSALADTEKRLVAHPENRRDQELLAACHLGLGQLAFADEPAADAQRHLRQALEIVTPLSAGSKKLSVALLHAEIVLELGDVDAARPMVEKILATGFRDPYYLEIYRRHGLDPSE